MPQKEVIRQIEEMQARQEQEKRKAGRPKGAKDKKPRKKPPPEKNKLMDPETGIIITKDGEAAKHLVRMGDERVTAFVLYHMEMMKMRQGVNLKDVPDLYNRFYTYLQYCAEHGITPGNMNAYFAIGISRDLICHWKLGDFGTPEQQQFARDISSFFASIHEQGAIDGVLNPISAMFWQKAHDGMVEASKLEVVNQNPLGEKKSAEDIAKDYAEVELPD